MTYNKEEFEQLFDYVESVIKAHGKFVIREPNSLAFRVTRYGWDVDVYVKLVNSRKRATQIHGEGDTPEAAATKCSITGPPSVSEKKTRGRGFTP